MGEAEWAEYQPSVGQRPIADAVGDGVVARGVDLLVGDDLLVTDLLARRVLAEESLDLYDGGLRHAILLGKVMQEWGDERDGSVLGALFPVSVGAGRVGRFLGQRDIARTPVLTLLELLVELLGLFLGCAQVMIPCW